MLELVRHGAEGLLYAVIQRGICVYMQNCSIVEAYIHIICPEISSHETARTRIAVLNIVEKYVYSACAVNVIEVTESFTHLGKVGIKLVYNGACI